MNVALKRLKLLTSVFMYFLSLMLANEHTKANAHMNKACKFLSTPFINTDRKKVDRSFSESHFLICLLLKSL